MVAAASNINGAGFGTVLPGQWHVHSDGGIYYNDSPLDTVIQALKVIPTALKLGGSVKKVLLSFGPFGSDFQGIQSNLALFKEDHCRRAGRHGHRRARLGPRAGL